MAKSRFPKSEGWITADLSLTSSDLWTFEEIKQWCSLIIGPDPEIGEYSQSGRKLRIIARIKPAPTESAAVA